MSMTPDRPVIAAPRFSVLNTSNPDGLISRYGEDFDKTPAQLAALYEPGGRANSENGHFYAVVDAAIALHGSTDEGTYHAAAVAMLERATQRFREMDEADLRALIDGTGAFNQSNIAMKEHCFDLALLHHLTGTTDPARRAAIILDRYSEVIPQWPLRERGGDERYSQDDMQFRVRWDSTGLYGGWVPLFPGSAESLLFSYDLIHNSGVMQKLGVLEDVQQMLRYHIEFNESVDKTYGNLDHHGIRSYCKFGQILPEPDYIHIALQWLDNILHATYFVSGFWHEGSPSYHKDITTHLSRTVPRLLKGYSDPPGYMWEVTGERVDNLDLAERYEPQFNRMWEALGKVTLPDNNTAVIHDTSYPRPAWWMPQKTQSTPKLLGCMGHVIMGRGEGENQQQAHLHFSGTHGHDHLDALNIIAWSQDREMISSTLYRAKYGEVSTREWHTMTAGQNTVVIDGENQHGRFSGLKRELTEHDAMPFPDWRYRDYGHGNSNNEGRLRIFATQYAPVQIVEASAEKSYYPKADTYRRTLAMIQVDEAHSYLVDIFRVQGGEMHDWMLHGCLQEPYTAATSVSLTPVDGVMHRYIEKLQAGQLADVETLSYEYEDGKASQHWLMMPEGSRLFVGEAPAMRRAGYSPFSFVRHNGGDSLFAAVHEFHSGDPFIAKTSLLATGTAGAEADVAVSIELADGTRDFFISRYDGQTPAHVRPEDSLVVRGGGAAWVRMGEDGSVTSAYGVGVSSLEAGQIQISGQVPAYTGTVTSTERVEAGDTRNALLTDTNLPTDGLLDGAAVILDYGETLSQAFVIDHVEAGNDASVIVLRNDPGFSIHDGLVKLHYFPGWGIQDRCRFTVNTTVLGEAAGSEVSVTPMAKSEWPEALEKDLYTRKFKQ
ncbi:MAG: heparinase II/III family protein [Armatimonadota bacterium]